MIQYIKFGQNPSFGSSERGQTSFFGSKFDIQSAGVTLKMRSTSTKSNHIFPMFQWCSCASLVKIHHSGDRVQTRLTFTVFIVWWPWKLGQGHQNVIKSFNYPSDTIHKVWPESIIWFKIQGANKLFFFLVKIWHSKCWCDLENEVKVTKN